MKVTLLAHTTLTQQAKDLLPQQPGVTDSDHLGELSGRACFQSWTRPRPETAATGDYLANIIRQRHLSILSHATATVYIEDVSRALTHELIRSRWISISELSQRYVNVEDTEPVLPPAVEEFADVDTRGGLSVAAEMNVAYAHAVQSYAHLVEALEGQGLTRKRAREAARAVMPNATPTAIVVSANFRAFRDLISQRIADGADREIQALARELLRVLRPLAPHHFSDFPEETS